MTIPQQILTIVAVVLGTMTTRFLPFLFFPEGKEPPAFIRYLGAVLPSAVIGLLVVFCLKDAVFTGWHGLPEAIAIVVVGVLHKCKHNILLSIAGGTVLYMFLVQTSKNVREVWKPQAVSGLPVFFSEAVWQIPGNQSDMGESICSKQRSCSHWLWCWQR